MAEKDYDIGDLVVITRGEWVGKTGIVSWPITTSGPGYVLLYSDKYVAGIRAAHEDVKPAEGPSQGYTQLTYYLIKLSSYLIEKTIL